MRPATRIPWGVLLALVLGLAGLALLGGAAYTAFGVAALALGATAFVALPAFWILLQSAAGAREVRPLSVK